MQVFLEQGAAFSPCCLSDCSIGYLSARLPLPVVLDSPCIWIGATGRQLIFAWGSGSGAWPRSRAIAVQTGVMDSLVCVDPAAQRGGALFCSVLGHTMLYVSPVATRRPSFNVVGTLFLATFGAPTRTSGYSPVWRVRSAERPIARDMS